MNSPAALLRAELQHASSLFEDFLARFFQENSERYAYGELFEPLYLDMTEFVARRGKRIRPMLLLGSYRIFGGDRSFEDNSLLRAALSLELLHSFILIHDDVIDQSERRRRLPTFHKLVEERLGKIDGAARVGGNVAVVVGDILFAMAVDTLRSTDFAPAVRDAALSHFLRYISDTGAGEVYDILLGTRDIARVAEADIARMYTLKTTRYTFEAPLVLGALLAGVDDDHLRELAELIEPVGLAFQIQNDLIEYHQFKGVDRLRQTDILEGKKTLLLRVAYDNLIDVDRSFLQLCLSTRTSNDASVSKIEQLIDKSGAVGLLTQKMESLFQKAEVALENSSFTPAQREGLREAFALVRQQTQQHRRLKFPATVLRFSSLINDRADGGIAEVADVIVVGLIRGIDSPVRRRGRFLRAQMDRETVARNFRHIRLAAVKGEAVVQAESPGRHRARFLLPFFSRRQRDLRALLLVRHAKKVAGIQQPPPLRAGREMHRAAFFPHIAQRHPGREDVAFRRPPVFPVEIILVPADRPLGVSGRRLIKQLHRPNLHLLGPGDGGDQAAEFGRSYRLEYRAVGNVRLVDFAQLGGRIVRTPPTVERRLAGLVFAAHEGVHARDRPVDQILRQDRWSDAKPVSLEVLRRFLNHGRFPGGHCECAHTW